MKGSYSAREALFKLKRRDDDREFYHFSRPQMLSTFDFEALLSALERGVAYFDFDARTGHNHGAKFRLRCNASSALYKNAVTICG